jgi:hypothetical protein
MVVICATKLQDGTGMAVEHGGGRYMGKHTAALRQLAQELLSVDAFTELGSIAGADHPKIDDVIAFDMRRGGPNFITVNCGDVGRYAVEDRDVFRPFQYCTAHFQRMLGSDVDEWPARDIVEMSSLHIEALVKRIGNAMNFPLGKALRNVLARRRIDPVTWDQIDRYTRIYNDAKHSFTHDKDTHMFSVGDAILAYFVSRALGAKLYPLAGLATNLGVFAS